VICYLLLCYSCTRQYTNNFGTDKVRIRKAVKFIMQQTTRECEKDPLTKYKTKTKKHNLQKKKENSEDVRRCVLRAGYHPREPCVVPCIVNIIRHDSI
jgi:hypothetical protein